MKPYGTDFNFGMFVAGDARSEGQGVRLPRWNRHDHGSNPDGH